MTGESTSRRTDPQKTSEKGLGAGKRVLFVMVVLACNLALFLAVDWVLVALDVLRPPFRYGVADLGFGRGPFVTSSDYGVESGFADSAAVTIAMVGDSHSAVLLDNVLDRHEFVLEGELRGVGAPAVVISAGRGRYSPLQEYLLYKLKLREVYSPTVVLMNLYAGNDFYDILRPDDRPHYVRRDDGSIELADPVWYAFADPDAQTWSEQSRLLWVIDEVSRRIGAPRIITRAKMLNATARKTGGSWGDVWAYMSDLKKSLEPRLEYDAAFSAQILNQAIFFKRFPNAEAESLAFMSHMMRTAIDENPGVTFVMAAIPSAALARAIPADVEVLWQETLARVSLNEEFVVELEERLYDQLRKAAAQNGWVFVDLLPALRDSAGEEMLYNPDDLHVNEAACAVIGKEQARIMLEQPGLSTAPAEAPRSKRVDL